MIAFDILEIYQLICVFISNRLIYLLEIEMRLYKHIFFLNILLVFNKHKL